MKRNVVIGFVGGLIIGLVIAGGISAVKPQKPRYEIHFENVKHGNTTIEQRHGELISVTPDRGGAILTFETVNGELFRIPTHQVVTFERIRVEG